MNLLDHKPDFSTFTSWERVKSGTVLTSGSLIAISERDPKTARICQVTNAVLTPGFEGGGRITVASLWSANPANSRATSSISFKSLRSNCYRLYVPPARKPEPEPEPETNPPPSATLIEIKAILENQNGLLESQNELLARLLAVWETR